MPIYWECIIENLKKQLEFLNQPEKFLKIQLISTSLLTTCQFFFPLPFLQNAKHFLQKFDAKKAPGKVSNSYLFHVDALIRYKKKKINIKLDISPFYLNVLFCFISSKRITLSLFIYSGKTFCCKKSTGFDVMHMDGNHSYQKWYIEASDGFFYPFFPWNA